MMQIILILLQLSVHEIVSKTNHDIDWFEIKWFFAMILCLTGLTCSKNLDVHYETTMPSILLSAKKGSLFQYYVLYPFLQKH